MTYCKVISSKHPIIQQWKSFCEKASLTLYFLLRVILYNFFLFLLIYGGLGFLCWGHRLGVRGWGFQLIEFGACGVGLSGFFGLGLSI